MTKRIILGLLVLSVAVLSAAIIIHNNHEASVLRSQNLMPLPAGYTEEAFEQGTLEVLSYKTQMLGTDIVIKQHAMVYLPENYDPDKKYDVMYLIHGRGGDFTTWLGKPANPRAFKNVLDHMIQDRIIDPMIVITPGLNYLYDNDDIIMDGISHEVAEELMPAAESKYSTYASGTDANSFIHSREHRIVAGFSMGGSATWHIMKDHIDYFKYYIPMSMAMYYDNNGYSENKSIDSSEDILNAIEQSGYGPEDYVVYAATGSEDFKATATGMQVYDLTNGVSFNYTDTDFKRGNITFKLWPGRWHRFTQSIPYIYNALMDFYDR